MDDKTRRAFELSAKLQSGDIDEQTFQSEMAKIFAGNLTSVEGSGSVASGNGAVSGGEGSVPVGRDVYGDITVINAETYWEKIRKKPTPEALKKNTEKYLNHLVEMHRNLDFRGMGVSDRVPLRMPLLEMYVPMKARIEIPKGDAFDRCLRLAGKRVGDAESEHMAERLSKPRPVIDLLRQNDGLIILGDPGAGKTTFLKQLAIRYAVGEAENIGLGDRIPFLLPLSAYANAIAEKDIPLIDFIGKYYADKGVDFKMDAVLDEALKNGAALLLMDGLDEVREINRRRTVVDRVIEFFVYNKQKGNKFILTSRIIGYRELRPNQDDLIECTLTDFEEEEISEFVEKWTRALERQAVGDTNYARREAHREKEELLLAVRRNPGVRELASNPLLLTILALMKRQGVTLPERRVELYEKYVETLIWLWNLARGLDPRFARKIDVAELNVTVRILSRLALWIQQTNPGVGLVKKPLVRDELIRIFIERDESEPEIAADRFINDIREYSGIIVERGHNEYGFIHLTFQEYLAAVAVCNLGQENVSAVVDILSEHAGDDNWHEVILLAIGYMGLIQGREKAADSVVLGIARSGKKAPGVSATVAGEAAADAWPGGISSECRKKMQDILLQTMTDDQNVEPINRVAAGNALSRLGDPRFDPNNYYLPYGEDMGFVTIPADEFLMGGDKNVDKQADDDEFPQHPIYLPEYRIAKYPVTVAQFRAFIEDANPKVGDEWKEYNEYDNHPVVMVSWYDAAAYCKWLTKKFKDKGFVFTLPSEAEWEKAARGTDGRIYPWGNQPDTNRANYSLRIRTTSPVGCYPGGKSPYECFDMAGNVWEWTRSIFKPYKYDPDDGREENDGDENHSRRILRGGSFSDADHDVRCASRSGISPNYRYGVFGFRVLFSPN